MSFDFKNVFPYISEIIGCAMFVALSIPMKFIKMNIMYKSFITVFVISISSLIYILSTYQSDKIEFNLLQNITNHNHIIESIIYTLSIVGFTIGFQYLPVSIAVPIGALITPISIIFNKFINNIEPTLYQILGSAIAFIGICIISFQQKKMKTEYLYGIIAIIIATCAISYVITITKNVTSKNIKNILFKNNVEMFDQTYFGVIILGIITIIYGLYTREKISLIEVGKLIVSLFFIRYIGFQFYWFAYNKLPENNYMELMNADMIISFLIGYFVFGENINMKKIIGVIIIISGIFLGIKR